MPRSEEYTLKDHIVRSGDRYAQAKYEITREWLTHSAQPGKTLLNIGCGAGYFNRIAHRMGLKVVACEPDPVAYQMAIQDRPDDTTVIYNCELDQLVRQGTRADYVVFHDVLEHIADDRSASRLLREVVNDDGRVIVSVPAMQWLYGKHDQELGHYRRYSRRALVRTLEPEFKIARIRYFGALSIPIVLLFSKLLRTSYPASGSGDSLLGRLYGALCSVETRVTFPTGTSIIAELLPRTSKEFVS